MRSRPGLVEPDVYFRIVHIAQVGRNNVPVAPYSEQAVEIAMGPKGAFENSNIGTLKRRVPTDRTVTAVLQVRGTPKPPREPRTPRWFRRLASAGLLLFPHRGNNDIPFRGLHDREELLLFLLGDLELV